MTLKVKFGISDPACKFYTKDDKQFEGYALRTQVILGDGGIGKEWLNYSIVDKEQALKAEDPIRFVLEYIAKNLNESFKYINKDLICNKIDCKS